MKKLVIWLVLLTCLFSVAQAQSNASCSWYEIFVRSYQDSDGDGIGDLQGVIGRLDYLEDMGFDGLWLMPVMPSPSYHKYDVTDYLGIDPEYGTLEDMKQLVQACHERGIRLIIDLPINHSSSAHPWFVQACAALRRGEEEHPCVEYYCFSRQDGPKMAPVRGTDWFYEEQFSGGGMPDLNLESEKVRAEITAIMDFWLNECGVDGFRLDAVTSYYAADVEKNVSFLRWLNDTAKELKPGCYLVGEAWTGLSTIAQYYESGVDSFFLFPASQAEGYIARTIRARSKPARQYEGFLQQVEEAMGDYLLAPFLGNHDTGRAAGSLQARSAPDRAKFAHTLTSLMGGAAFTYYGDEIGMVGSGDDPNKRLAMYWNASDMTNQPPGVTKTEYAFPCVDEQLQDEYSLLNYIKKLNHLKRDHPAIAFGRNEFVYNDGDVCAMKRIWEGQECWILVNFSAGTAHSGTIAADVENLVPAQTLDVGETASRAWVEDGEIQFELAPYGLAVLVR
ncbi:MAG: hypothetical protein IJE08_00800 [Clostridia bacterium]|nr:hypothetical protein [Clostridia bacterium]